MDAEKIIKFINEIESGSFNYTYQPVFLSKRKDIAIVRKSIESAVSHLYDVIYLVWQKGAEIKVKELMNSKTTGDYIYIWSAKEYEDRIIIEVGHKKFEILFDELF